MGVTDTGGNWVLFWWAGPCSVNLYSNFLLMGGAVFPSSCLTWDQTMVEVMKIMAPSFKRSGAPTASLSAPDPASRPPPTNASQETPGHSQASLAQSLVGSLLLPPGSWCAQGFLCALQASVFPVLWKFCNQTPLAFTVKFPGGSQSLHWIPRLGNLLWVLELS